MFRATCLVTIAFAISACSQSDAVTSVNGPPVADAARPSAATGFTRVDLGTLGGTSSYAAAISSAGVVVGWSETKTGDTHAFRWTPSGGMVDLSTLPGEATSQAVAILDGSPGSDSQILGTSGRDAVVWSTAASISRLPLPFDPASGFAHPQGFNARGEVVGFDAGGDLGQHAWIWSAREGKSDLSNAIEAGSNEASASAITFQGVALLTARATTCTGNAQCWRTYFWSKQSGIQQLGLPDHDSEASVAGLALNDDRTVVGWTGVSGRVAPYRWTATAGFTILPNYPSAKYAYATSVNSIANTVGAAVDPRSGSIVATLWPVSGGIERLSPDDPNPSVATAINGSGTIAGWASVASGVNHAVIWVPSSRLTRQLISGAVAATIPSAPSSFSEQLSAPTDGCLKQIRFLKSRAALFDCVIEVDRARHARSR